MTAKEKATQHHLLIGAGVFSQFAVHKRFGNIIIDASRFANKDFLDGYNIFIKELRDKALEETKTLNKALYLLKDATNFVPDSNDSARCVPDSNTKPI